MHSKDNISKHFFLRVSVGKIAIETLKKSDCLFGCLYYTHNEIAQDP